MKRLLLPVLIILALVPIFALDVQRDIVQQARKYIGNSYSTGGINPPEFDCSGFVGYIIRPFVPNLPRLSRDMASSGKKISKEELSPGDLVFFATTAVPDAVSHVALYIGQDSIIHAISEGPDRGVNITPLDSRYWKNHYHSAVRVLQPGDQRKTPSPDMTEKPIQFAKGIYTGELRGGEPHGKGMLELNNGDVYRGAFADGSFNGTGTYVWLNGEKYEGGFRDDAFHGKGIFTQANGSARAVVFEKGVLVNPPESASAKTDKPASAPAENYLQKEDSPWDTWTGYISGDYDQWKAQQDKAFEEAKNAFSKDAELDAYAEWKKKNR